MSEGTNEASAKKITIRVDREVFHLEVSVMTGSQIRHLVTPPIGPDWDLFLVQPGPSEDLRISDDETVTLKSGMEFFSAPTTINPGSHAARR